MVASGEYRLQIVEILRFQMLDSRDLLANLRKMGMHPVVNDQCSNLPQSVGTIDGGSKAQLGLLVGQAQ